MAISKAMEMAILQDELRDKLQSSTDLENPITIGSVEIRTGQNGAVEAWLVNRQTGNAMKLGEA